MHAYTFLRTFGLASCLAAIGCSSAETSAPVRGRGSSTGVGFAGSGANPSFAGSSAVNGQPGSIATVPPINADNGKVCASAVVQTAKNNPTVVFVIDGSGSMCAPFGNGATRWSALRSALLDP